MIDYELLGDILVPLLRPALTLGDPAFPLIQIPNKFGTPDRSFASLEILDITPVGQLEHRYIFNEGQQIRQDQNVSIRVQSFGEKSRTRLANLAVYLELASTTQKLHEAGICWRSTSAIKNLPRIATSEYEERASLDFRLGTSWGNFEATSKDPNTEGQPSSGAFDEEIVPVEQLTVNVYVDDTPETSGDERLINSTTIT